MEKKDKKKKQHKENKKKKKHTSFYYFWKVELSSKLKVQQWTLFIGPWYNVHVQKNMNRNHILNLHAKESKNGRKLGKLNLNQLATKEYVDFMLLTLQNINPHGFDQVKAIARFQHSLP